jgi:methylmalonyl-CoA/ethylmalonyl-CoA epimerase
MENVAQGAIWQKAVNFHVSVFSLSTVQLPMTSIAPDASPDRASISPRDTYESSLPPTTVGAARTYQRIDHIAIAVSDLDASVRLFRDVLGFQLLHRRTIKGARTGMISAEMSLNGITFVLCQGTEPESQVSQLIAHFGPGVAHIALAVADVHATVDDLKSAGLAFDTSAIVGPGLTQAFSSRCPHSGLCFEFIARGNTEGFLESNVQQLFDQLERSGKY